MTRCERPLAPLLAALALAAGASLARAQVSERVLGGSDGGYNAFHLAPLIPHAFPSAPLAPGENRLKIVPAYLRLDYAGRRPDNVPEGAKTTGFGAGVSFLRGISRRWSFAGLAALQRNSGDAVSLVELTRAAKQTDARIPDSDIVQTFRGDTSGVGALLAAGAVFDPFGGGKGEFRLPLFFGAAFGFAESEVTDRRTMPAGDIEHSEKTSHASPGAAIGLAAQIPAGPFRLVPSLTAIFFAGEVETEERQANHTAGWVRETTLSHDSSTGGAGLEVVYAPWGLGATFVLPVEEFTPKAFTLKWERRW